MTDIDKEIAPEIAQACRAWPFEEARQIIKRLRAMNRGEIKPGPKGYVLFETGYGPSGLPHIGTFGEVARTTMVLRAFKRLAPEIPVKLTCFSDDMDGLRKVPTNVPNPELLTKALGMPLSSVPNPFESDHLSFAEHNNDRLKEFLDSFGFEYEFLSSTADCYTNGRFNDALRIMLEKYNEVREAVLPILGAERTETYSPSSRLYKRNPPMITTRSSCTTPSCAKSLMPIKASLPSKFSTTVKKNAQATAPEKQSRKASLTEAVKRNGVQTGHCVGMHWMSITKWPVKTLSPPQILPPRSSRFSAPRKT